MKKIKKYLNYAIYSITHRSSKKERPYIFILSHKRGRTTLLSHILASHSKICGYRELHCSYDKGINLTKSKVALYEDPKSFEQADFLHDKLLHNELLVDESLFSKLPKYIFVLREPQATMLSMLKRHLDVSDPKTLHIQADYYITRLKQLQNLWKTVKGPKLFVDSDEMVANTSNSLAGISKFIELEQPLSEEYQTFKHTGTAGMGDMSGSISQGKIIPQKKQLLDADFELLSKVDMKVIKDVYLETKNVFLANA